MHREFPHWYQAALVEPDPAQVKEGWALVERLVKAWNKAPNFLVALDLIRLATGRQAMSSEQTKTLLEEMNLGDPKSMLKQRGFALQVLIGAALLVEQPEGKEADVLALAAACAGFGRRSNPVPIEQVARNYLCKRSVEMRNEAMAEFAPKALAISKEFPQVRRTQESVLQEQVDALQEQRDILLWLLAGHSGALGLDYTQIAMEGSALIAAHDLVDLTRIIPGPLAAPAFLHKIMGTPPEAPSLTLRQAIESTPLHWRQQVTDKVASSPALDLCPVHEMVQRSLQTTPGSDWGGDMYNPTRIALQTYEEALLLRLTQPEASIAG